MTVTFREKRNEGVEGPTVVSPAMHTQHRRTMTGSPDFTSDFTPRNRYRELWHWKEHSVLVIHHQDCSVQTCASWILMFFLSFEHYSITILYWKNTLTTVCTLQIYQNSSFVLELQRTHLLPVCFAVEVKRLTPFKTFIILEDIFVKWSSKKNSRNIWEKAWRYKRNPRTCQLADSKLLRNCLFTSVSGF